MVQHAGAVYHFSQAQMHVPPVEDMISRAFKDVYGLDFGRYSLLALIANEHLRKWLQDAERILNEGGPVLTIAACKFAHRLVIAEVQPRTRNRWPTRIRTRGLDVRDLVSIQAALKEITDEFEREFEALEQEVVAIGVGLSILEARRFRSVGQYVQLSVTMDGSMWLNIRDDRPFKENREAAEYMLAYLSRLVRYIDQTFGEALQNLNIEVPLMEQRVIKDCKACF